MTFDEFAIEKGADGTYVAFARGMGCSVEVVLKPAPMTPARVAAVAAELMANISAYVQSTAQSAPSLLRRTT